MKWLLMVMIVSSWDGTYKNSEKIGQYTNQIACEKQAHIFNDWHNSKDYYCIEEVKNGRR